MTTTREGSAIAKKQLAQRELLWRGAEPWLWHRKANKGFATIPKTMPIILQIMDDLSNGKPVSSTYLGLWCATWDNSMVSISRQNDMAHTAGFTGQRASYTWAGRIKILQDLKFIDVKPGKSGPISHILLCEMHTGSFVGITARRPPAWSSLISMRCWKKPWKSAQMICSTSRPRP